MTRSPEEAASAGRLEKCRSDSHLGVSPRRPSPLAALSIATNNTSSSTILTTSSSLLLRSEAYSDVSGEVSDATPRSDELSPRALSMFSPNARRPRCYSLDLSKIQRPNASAERSHSTSNSPRPASPLSTGRSARQASPRCLYSISAGTLLNPSTKNSITGHRRRSFHGELDLLSPASPRVSSTPSSPHTKLETCPLVWHEELGHGATATIYRATATLTDSTDPLTAYCPLGLSLAVKVIRTETFAASEHQAVQAEISLWRSLQHPNLLPLLGVRRASQQLQLLMPLCSYSLRSYLHTKTTIGEDCQLALARELAAALNYLHQRPAPIVHRDVKPENIMLLVRQDTITSPENRAFTALLGDFSEAFILDTSDHHCHQANRGTLLYRAPEMCHNSFDGEVSYNEKVDIWAFGQLLGELLSGRPPYHDEPDAEIVRSLISKGQRPNELLILRDRATPSLAENQVRWQLLQMALCCTERRSNDRPSAHKCYQELLTA